MTRGELHFLFFEVTANIYTFIFLSGFNKIIAVTLEAKKTPLTDEQEKQLARVTTQIQHPFEDLAMNYRYQQRQKKGLCVLSQYEWEQLTHVTVLNAVGRNDPPEIASRLLLRASPFERSEFYSLLVKQDVVFNNVVKAARASVKKAKKAEKAKKA